MADHSKIIRLTPLCVENCPKWAILEHEIKFLLPCSLKIFLQSILLDVAFAAINRAVT